MARMQPANRSRRQTANCRSFERSWITTITAPYDSCRTARSGAVKSCLSRCNSSIAASSIKTGSISMRSQTAKRRKLSITGEFLVRRHSAPKPDVDLGFAGFRLSRPINKPITMTRFASSLARAISAPSQRESYMGSRLAAFDQHGEAKARSFLRSSVLDRENRPKTPPPSSCTRYWTARAPRRPIDSR